MEKNGGNGEEWREWRRMGPKLRVSVEPTQSSDVIYPSLVRANYALRRAWRCHKPSLVQPLGQNYPITDRLAKTRAS